MKKRLFALFLCLCMMMTLLPVGAFAEGTEAQSGLAAGGASVTSVNPVETPDTHITFKFYNGETLLDTQVVNGNGQLTAPATPAIEGGRKFLGWYAVDVNDQLEAQEFDFSNAYTNYSGRSEVKVMAKFEAVFYVYFMTVDGQVHSTAIANEASGFKVALPTDYEPKGKVVTGWKANGAVFTADTVVSADTYVYPVTEDCYWVTFNTTGGSMVASCSVTKGDTLNLSGITAPTRTGYRFKGWSTTADGALISSVTPTADTTLYAVWEGDDVKYMVVYWGENADDTNYSALATATLTGKVGSTVTLNATTGALPNSVSDSQHFKFSSSDSATIRADGSSVLNVYFSRNSYTLTFRKYTWELFGGNYETVATITAKYNASIFAEFGKPPFNTTYNGRAWECTDSSKYNYALQTLDRMPGFDATFNLYDKSSNKLKTIYYYVQNVGTTVNSSRWPTSTANFSLYKEVQTYFNYATYDEEYHNIDGFNRYSASVAGFYRNQKDFSNNTLYLYYMRKSYTLTFNNYGAVSDNTVEYEAKLDSYNNYVPARPEGFSENAVFMGWYTVPVAQITDTTLPYDFSGKTMPLDGLTLYAYWVEKPVTLTVQVPTLGGYTASNYEVAIGTVISGVDVFKDAEAKIAEAGKTVLKWVYEDGTAVDVNSAIGSDTIVKAVLKGDVYTLTYVTGTDAAITDENSYEYGALAQVKDGSGLKSGDKVFAYWTDETSKVYYPGSYVTMTGNKTLIANYVDPSVKVTLTYHSNFDTDQTKTIDAVPNNDKVSVMAYDATGMATRPGYEFKGWADTADADTANYPAGSEARLDNNGSNDLYAVWEAIDVDYTVEFYYQNADGTYPTSANSSETRQGKTDSTVSVTAADKADKENGKYVYDGDAVNVESGVVAANGSLVLKLYFKLNQASYTVRYLWNGTEDKVADDKVVADQTVGQTITEDPITVGGYTAVSTDSQSITLVPDSSSNIITFYYYKNVELTANSATHEYNGFEQSVEGFTGAPEGFDFSAITVGAAGTDVGEYPAKFAEGTVGTKDSTGKYIVVKATDGMLKITPISNVITITANSKDKAYDGTALTDSGYSFTQGILLRGDVLHVSVKGSQTNFGSSDNVVKSYKVTRDGVDVTNNYTFGASQKGTLTVTPRPVTLTSGGGEKEYDGNPLTNPTVTVGGSGFVAGEGATYNVTGSQTDKGSSKNWFTYTLTEGTKADNYTITQEYGELVVTKNTSVINITAKSANKTYDGQALTETRYDFTQNILAEGDVLTAVVEGSQTDAGSSANVVKSYKVMRGDVDVTDFYTFGEIENGTLTVTERKVTLTSKSADKPYDGTPLTSPDVTVSDEGFVDGEVSDIKAIGTITDKGSVPNTITFTEGENFKASNYIIVRETGTLTITADATEVVVYISGNTGTEKYDGTEKTVTGYKVTSISSDLYKESDFAFTGNATVSATDARATSYPMGLTAGNFENTNENFSKVTFIVTDGSLTITPRTVTLTSESATKEYDGTPLTRPDVTVSGDGFVEGEVSGIKATGSITYYGEVDNDIKYTKEAGYKDSNYIVTSEIGKLGITRSSKELKVVANSGTWEYDGKFHADGGYTVTFGEESYTVAAGESAKLSTGDTVTAIITKQVKNVADSADGNNAIVTLTIDNAAQYANVSQANGTLTITAKPLTITADSAEKVYDGQPLTKNSFTNTELAEGDKLTATVTGSQTNVGSSDNVASAAVIMAGEENVTANYTITYEKGSLTVTPVTDEVIVTVTERGGDYLYDGGEKVVTGYDAVSSNPLYTANDYSFSGDATVKSTNAGSYDMELAPEDFKNTSANFTNVTFIIVDGKLNIAQRKVLMTSADDEKVYDGTPLTNSTVTVTGDGFAEGEGAAYTVTGSQLDEGSSNNSFTYELNEGTLAANYIIETKEGELTVKPILTEITITASSGEKMYDGSALINGGYTFTSGILVDGDVLTAVVEGSQLNAGSSANVVKSYRVMRGETDVTANYRFAESVDGKLTVTARKVVMTSADDEKVYDGTPLTNDEITVTGDGFIEGEGVTYDVTGSQLDVGSSDNSFTYELNEGTLAENYIIETEEGKLTVTSPEQHIVITANSAEKTYDGTPLTDDGFTYTDFVLAEGDVLEAVVEGSQTDAGSSVNVIKSYRVMRGDEDVTANYIFDDSVDGTLTVTKRKVTLTSGTACKIYDGKYLTCNKVEVGGDGFVEGEGATYDVTGKRKDIGWSYNDFTYKLNDNTKADNYEITVERGFLYVKDQAEKPKTGDSSDLLLLLALMSMSGAGAAGTVYLYRRKREEQE